MKKPQVFAMSFSSVYPLYIEKAVKKGRTKEDVDLIIFWLTGYDQESLQKQLDAGTDLETFYTSSFITGVALPIDGGLTLL